MIDDEVGQIAELIHQMIEVCRNSNQPEHNLNYRRAYEPIARAVIELVNQNRA